MCGYAYVWVNISSLWHGKDMPFERPTRYVMDSGFWNTLSKSDMYLECENGYNLFLRNHQLFTLVLKIDIFSSRFLDNMISISQSLLLALLWTLKWISSPFRFWVWDGLEDILLWYLCKVYFSVPILAWMQKKSGSFWVDVWNVRKFCRWQDASEHLLEGKKGANSSFDSFSPLLTKVLWVHLSTTNGSEYLHFNSQVPV